ncbi:Endopolyphosphatase [Metschnikowia bicuspidata var. bicuspidata NRRL YB-4993]|uniref:Endopolyphosphatase n=1 Tax=Metschnikowia bicuspidata var. bicuspidata NRRL YB-4993 TaxID=869754 RepID=A0A1A0HIJ6_9ASCO|nr:Endopolyphosphatase [Metschnikowia bicuspidata var. bicuspidata NRRL YB-4993]OBA23707.1 Endopolyphosphatase [Metschnikowia bicuspidata var. bicuspidata NRRL YB-4993]
MFWSAAPHSDWLQPLRPEVHFGFEGFPEPISWNEHTTRYIVEPVLTSSSTDSLRKLGLTPKKSVEITVPETGKKRTIHGRFLHITDFHPDPHYRAGSNVDNMCHGGEGQAGKYGDAILGCDAPMILVEQTIDWIAENLKDKIDFIVWTGDNMRHDNDRQYPRTEQDIFAMNEQISDLMYKKFGDMPVPSLGNNDVYPHNLFAPGPTLQTRELYKIWRPFVPQSQLHIFNRGVYFFQEIIPNKMAILSINTLYLFQSNPLVETCDKRKDPGYKLFLWLGYVLKEMRQRNMKVWLTGHVPPTAKNYDISCLRKYILWSHEYRDVIIGGLYGHMNIDHFLPLDAKQAYKSMEKKFSSLGYQAEQNWDSDSDDEGSLVDFGLLEELYGFYNSSVVQDTVDSLEQEFGFDLSFSRNIEIQGGTPMRKVNYMNSVREGTYAKIKGRKKSGAHGERYSVVHVASSIVPTFNPGMRVWEYNITELYETESYQGLGWDQFFAQIDQVFDQEEAADDDDMFATFKEKAKALKRDKTIPRKMPKNTPLGPAYVPQLFTPERYVQYYLDLKSANDKTKDFGYEIEYTTDDKSGYKMKDLSVAEWLKLGRKLGQPIRNKDKADTKGKQTVLSKLWLTFLCYSFVNSDYENLGYG